MQVPGSWVGAGSGPMRSPGSWAGQMGPHALTWLVGWGRIGPHALAPVRVATGLHVLALARGSALMPLTRHRLGRPRTPCSYVERGSQTWNGWSGGSAPSVLEPTQLQHRPA